MMNKTIIFILLSVFSLITCKGKNTSIDENQSGLLCITKDSVLNIIDKLPEVENLKTGNSKIALIVFPNEDSTVYDIRVGINSELRFQTFFIFLVKKMDCSIDVYNQLSGNTFPLSEWQSRYKAYLSGDKEAFDTNEEDVSNASSLQKLYEEMSVIRLPLLYDFEFIVEQTDFINVTKEFYHLFKLDYLDNLKVAKLETKKDIKPILVFGYNEFGQSNLYILTLDDTYKVNGKLEIYFTDENGSTINFEEITQEYRIILNINSLKKEIFQIQDNGSIDQIDSLN